MEKGYAQQYPKNAEHGSGLPQKEKVTLSQRTFVP
jgi:hypothetical protein